MGTLADDRAVRDAFYAGWTTAARLLRYYEMGGFAGYDLRQVILNQDPAIDVLYQKYDVVVANALYDVTGDTAFLYWRDLWEREINP